MKKKIMLCGVDCKAGDANCNNYCNHDTSRPMADHPPAATKEQQLAFSKFNAQKKLGEARDAQYEYFCDLVDIEGESDKSHRAYGLFVILREQQP